jgi:hypothetical protein
MAKFFYIKEKNSGKFVGGNSDWFRPVYSVAPKLFANKEAALKMIKGWKPCRMCLSKKQKIEFVVLSVNF